MQIVAQNLADLLAQKVGLLDVMSISVSRIYNQLSQRALFGIDAKPIFVWMMEPNQ